MRGPSIKDDTSPWAPGKVSDFFKALLIPDEFNKIEKTFLNTKIWNGFIFVNQTFKLSDDMTPKLCRKMTINDALKGGEDCRDPVNVLNIFSSRYSIKTHCKFCEFDTGICYSALEAEI